MKNINIKELNMAFNEIERYSYKYYDIIVQAAKAYLEEHRIKNNTDILPLSIPEIKDIYDKSRDEIIKLSIIEMKTGIKQSKFPEYVFLNIDHAYERYFHAATGEKK